MLSSLDICLNPHQEADVALVHEMCLLSAAAVCGPKMLGLRIEFLLSLPGQTPKCQDFQANSELPNFPHTLEVGTLLRHKSNRVMNRLFTPTIIIITFYHY